MEFSFRENFKEHYYYKRHQLSNKQVCELRMYQYRAKDCTQFCVAFVVANKKKHIAAWFGDYGGGTRVDMKTTGKAGIEPLMWCKEQLLLFQKQIVRHYRKYERIKIVIYATDAKRFHAYRYMKRYGYVEGVHFGCRALVKNFHAKDCDNIIES